MKLLLLKFLWQSRAKEEGYVLPMVMAIGLVMVLLGLVNMTSANEENINAITKNSRSDALAIAEIGIAQYRELLNRNRVLTVYNRAQWTNNNVNGVDVAGQTCDVITNTLNGWASNEPAGTAFNAVNWRAVQLNETVINRDLNNDGDAADVAVDVGWYKIVDYEYDIDGNLGGTDNDGVIDATDDNGLFSVVSDANTADDTPGDPNFGSLTVANLDENDNDDDGQSDARGILTVKGRTPDGGEAQIQVEIPLRINQQDMNNLAPALWIGSGNTANLGGLVVGDTDGDNLTDDLINNLTGANGADTIPDANIVVSNPNDGTNAGCDDVTVAGNNNNIISDSRSLPSIAAITQTITDAENAAGGNRLNDFSDLQSLGSLNFLGALNHSDYNPDIAPGDFDPATDCTAAADCRYYYDNLPGTITGDLSTDGISRATLYQDGNLIINAGASDATIGSIVSSQFLEIYSTTNIDINTNGQNLTINALIHTPGTLTISGGGTLTINGSVWVGDFINNITTVGAVKINPDNTDTSSTAFDRSYEFYTTTTDITPRPLTDSPTNWRTEEVN
ncbi:MAG: hypothetical protein AAFQ80_09415 [Cyanobacteria bacterium J06621_8]